MSTVKQSQEDLEQQLADQIGFLKRSAIEFDSGITSEAKRMALAIRDLVHDTTNSVSLLQQLGWKGRFFCDTSVGIDMDNMADQNALALRELDWSGPATYRPFLDDVPDGRKRWVAFDDWW